MVSLADNFFTTIMYHISSYIWARVGIVFLTSVYPKSKFNKLGDKPS